MAEQSSNGDGVFEDEPRGIRAAAVTAWLEANLDAVAPPLRFRLIEGGHSNITYEVRDAEDRRLVLRRPPIGSILKTAHDMAREHRIISALAASAVPVPPALALCEDDSVNDAPFYVMAFVEGEVLDTASKVESGYDESSRRRLGESVADVLVELHAVDPDEVGLGTLGKKEEYLARQIRRWTMQWEKSKTRELPAMERLSRELREAMPAQQGAAVVHGDYRLGNMLAAPDGAIAAVLDWELCTLGDPLADVGYLLNDWADPGDPAVANAVSRPPSAASGSLPRAELLARYAAASERDLSGIAYYRAFQYWRLAAICEGVLDRYLDGKMAGQIDTDLYARRVDTLAAAAVGMMDTL